MDYEAIRSEEDEQVREVELQEQERHQEDD